MSSFRKPWRTPLLGSTLFFAMMIWIFWHARNPDTDDGSPLLTQLIPAGHCACQSSTTFECSSCLTALQNAKDHQPPSSWQYEYGRDDQNVGLAEDQCLVAFPGLFEDINHGVEYWQGAGTFFESILDQIDIVSGLTRAMIFDGHLYVIATKSETEDYRQKAVATLSSIHRALAGYPNPRELPNLEFVFSIEDKAEDFAGNGFPLWALARKATEEWLWLMPAFGFWAWDDIIDDESNEIGPYDEIVEKAIQVEKGMSFANKEPKLVWRGETSFAPELRRALLDQSKGKEWSDVRELDWSLKQNYLTLEDHCNYQFIAHVEGRPYSASLKYRQACRSVIIAHNMQYIQPHHYLLVSSGPLQNYVEVERDFSNLGSKMANLLDNPAKAAKIADSSVRVFRERYLTPAAEACYWRALWRAYGNLSEPAKLMHTRSDGKVVKRGLRYESFMLLSSEEMLDFAAG